MAEPVIIGRWQCEGCIIHHKDRDAMNDDIANLECMTRAEHINEHRHELKVLADG